MYEERNRGCCVNSVFVASSDILSATIKKKGYAMAQLVEALRYKPEGRGFDFRWCHSGFPLTL